MLRLILGNTNALPSRLWRFVRSDFTFSDPQAPWNFEWTRTLRGITNATPGQSFLGISLGDDFGSSASPFAQRADLSLLGSDDNCHSGPQRKRA